MTARTVYFKSGNVRDLLAAQNAFFTKYQVQARGNAQVTLFKADIAFNQLLNEYESFLTIDMPVGGAGRLDQVDNTRFNVSTPEEQEEVRRMEQQQQQDAIPMSA